MTAIVIGMVLIVIVALVVIAVFSEEEDDWTKNRPAAWTRTKGTSTTCSTDAESSLLPGSSADSRECIDRRCRACAELSSLTAGQ